LSRYARNFSNVDIIVDIDEEWVKKIQMQKFQWHNSEWLASITQATSDNAEGYEESAVIYANPKGVEAAAQRERMEEYREYEDSSEDSSEDDRMFQQTLKNTL
jgi:hypothetical protein